MINNAEECRLVLKSNITCNLTFQSMFSQKAVYIHSKCCAVQKEKTAETESNDDDKPDLLY